MNSFDQCQNWGHPSPVVLLFDRQYPDSNKTRLLRWEHKRRELEANPSALFPMEIYKKDSSQ